MSLSHAEEKLSCKTQRHLFVASSSLKVEKGEKKTQNILNFKLQASICHSCQHILDVCRGNIILSHAFSLQC